MVMAAGRKHFELCFQAKPFEAHSCVMPSWPKPIVQPAHGDNDPDQRPKHCDLDTSTLTKNLLVGSVALSNEEEPHGYERCAADAIY